MAGIERYATAQMHTPKARPRTRPSVRRANTSPLGRITGCLENEPVAHSNVVPLRRGGAALGRAHHISFACATHAPRQTVEARASRRRKRYDARGPGRLLLVEGGRRLSARPVRFPDIQ